MLIGGIETAEVEDKMADEAIAAPGVKKITLKFNGLAEESVQRMAAATCFDPVTEEELQRREFQLKTRFDELAKYQTQCTQMLGAGAAYLSEVAKTHDSITDALDKLGRQPLKPSLLARIMGKGNASKETMANIKDLVENCKGAVEQLDHSLDGVHAAIKKQRKIIDGVFEDIGPEGSISPEMAHALHSSVNAADETGKQYQQLRMASDTAKMNCGALSAKAVQISLSQMMTAGP